MATWLTDSTGNKCSVEYFGTKEKAQAVLDSLNNCENCTNCSYCSDCSGCSGCSDCSDCSGCSYCSDCSGCSDKKETKGAFVRPKIPAIENIHQKVYEAVSHPDALQMDNWHTCETTHCRGGWVVTLAGEEGKALEGFFGSLLAAQLIYRESGYKIKPCRFFDSNDESLADMKKLAEEEAAR